MFNSAPDVVEKTGDGSLTRLKALYTQAKELSETEVTYVEFFLMIICYVIFAFFDV